MLIPNSPIQNGIINPGRNPPFTRTAVLSLLAENEDSYYTAYVSQQNLMLDGDSGPVDHPELITCSKSLTVIVISRVAIPSTVNHAIVILFLSSLQ